MARRKASEVRVLQRTSALVSGLAAPVRIEWQVHKKGLVSALRTGLAWADVAIDADAAENALVIEIKGRCVAKLFGMLQLTTERDGETMVLRLKIDRRAIDSAADCEEAVAVRQFDKLRNDNASQSEGHMHLPHRAGAAIFSEVERGGIEAFSNISCFIDAQEKEWHTLGAWPLERGQPVTGLFERDPEARSEAVNIVPHRLGFTQERFVWHEERGREVISELDMTTREARSRFDFAPCGQLIK